MTRTRYGVSRFKVELELGNDALKTRRDLVSLLREVLPQIAEVGKEGAVIRDENGNTVGRWRLILSAHIKKGWES